MDFSRMSAYLDSFYQQKNIPGVGCAIYCHHRRVYDHYAGFSNVEEEIPFGPDTLFNLYSATKLITCVSALQLIEWGKMRLSDPLYAFLPEYRHMAVKHALPDGGEELRDAEVPITIEHLFTMASGISGNRDTDAVRRVIEETKGKAPTVAAVRAMAAAPLIFEPGTRFLYGYCHDVLAAVVEVVSGRRFSEQIRESILAPIGMMNTAFTVPSEKMSHLALQYEHFDAKVGKAERIGECYSLKVGEDYECGGGGLYSSVGDYILFAETLCNDGISPSGAKILSGEAIDDMRTNRLHGKALEDFQIFGGWSKAGYGYGLGVRTLMDRERNNSLSENGEFGWDGAKGCYVVVDPKAELALFYAQQEAGSRWYEWHGTVRNYAYASAWS